ncbi:hypothetical protein HanIR_Chr11g0515271 [Helianthus annuus]|nr:hypothetical protein HanIR_Chr11g0515271 [Helianthus annuus]
MWRRRYVMSRNNYSMVAKAACIVLPLTFRMICCVRGEGHNPNLLEIAPILHCPLTFTQIQPKTHYWWHYYTKPWTHLFTLPFLSLHTTLSYPQHLSIGN